MSSSSAGKRAAVIGLGAGIVVFAGLYVSAYAANGSGVPKGTEVLGVDIGGMSVKQAQTALGQELPKRPGRKVTVQAGGETFVIGIASAGLSVDVRETLARAGGRSLNPLDLLPTLFGSTETLEPVLAVDETKLAKAVKKIADAVNQEGSEGGISFADGAAVRTAGAEGRELDVAATVEALKAAVKVGAVEATAPVTVKAPSAPASAVDDALRSFAEPAMSGPVTLEVGSKKVELTPAEIGKYLTMDPKDGALVPHFDGVKFAKDLAKSDEGLGTAAKNASFTFDDNGRPKILPSKPGRRLDPELVGEAMVTVLASTTDRTLDAVLEDVEPETSTVDLEALGIKEKVSSFRTEYPIAPYRITNIGRAAKLINKSLVLPGETWSLNKTVGERTAANGFVKGFIIRGGNFTEDLGGGVSQSATTTFNAVFFAGLKDVEHHTHSLYISRYPPGREATVAFGTKDLRFQNDSGNGILIQAVGKPGFIRVTMWGTKKYERIEAVASERSNYRSPSSVISTAADCETQQPVDGFDIDVTRLFYLDGEVVKREKFHTRYDPTDKITCEKPRATPSSKPESTSDPSVRSSEAKPRNAKPLATIEPDTEPGSAPVPEPEPPAAPGVPPAAR